MKILPKIAIQVCVVSLWAGLPVAFAEPTGSADHPSGLSKKKEPGATAKADLSPLVPPASQKLSPWAIFADFAPGVTYEANDINPAQSDTLVQPKVSGSIGGSGYIVDTCSRPYPITCIELAVYLKVGIGDEVSRELPDFKILAGLEEFLYFGAQRRIALMIQGGIGYAHAFTKPKTEQTSLDPAWQYDRFTNDDVLFFTAGAGIFINLRSTAPGLGIYFRVDYYSAAPHIGLVVPVGLRLRF